MFCHPISSYTGCMLKPGLVTTSWQTTLLYECACFRHHHHPSIFWTPSLLHTPVAKGGRKAGRTQKELVINYSWQTNHAYICVFCHPIFFETPVYTTHFGVYIPMGAHACITRGWLVTLRRRGKEGRKVQHKAEYFWFINVRRQQQHCILYLLPPCSSIIPFAHIHTYIHVHRTTFSTKQGRPERPEKTTTQFSCTKLYGGYGLMINQCNGFLVLYGM